MPMVLGSLHVFSVSRGVDLLRSVSRVGCELNVWLIGVPSF